VINETQPQVLKNSAIVVVVQFAGIIVKFFSNIMLAWFLTPDAFGIAAIVTTIFMALSLLSDVGIGDNIVRNPDGEKADFYQSCFSLQIVRGVVLYAVLALIALPLANLYGDEIIRACLLVGGISLLIDGFLSTRFYVLQRNHQVKKLALLDLTAQLIAAIVVIIYCLFSPTVWALVIGHVVSSVVKTIGSHYVAPMSFAGYRLITTRYQEILSFGKWIFLNTLFHFVITQSDKLILGKLIPTHDLGIYAISASLTAITMMLSYNFSLRIVYPVLSQAARGSGENYAEKIHETMRHILPALLVFCLFTFALAPLFFEYLYKDSYLAAGQVTQYLALMTWFMILYDLYQKVPVSYGFPKHTATISFFTSIFRVGMGITAFHFYGIPGFIMGLALGSIIGVGLVQVWMTKYQIKTDTYEIKLSLIFISLFLLHLLLKQYAEIPYFNVISAVIISLFAMSFGYLSYKKPIHNQYLKFRSKPL
jgi:O-antigen/teichoic acid export membrane protein